MFENRPVLSKVYTRGCLINISYLITRFTMIHEKYSFCACVVNIWNSLLTRNSVVDVDTVCLFKLKARLDKF